MFKILYKKKTEKGFRFNSGGRNVEVTTSSSSSQARQTHLVGNFHRLEFDPHMTSSRDGTLSARVLRRTKSAPSTETHGELQPPRSDFCGLSHKRSLGPDHMVFSSEFVELHAHAETASHRKKLCPGEVNSAHRWWFFAVLCRTSWGVRRPDTDDNGARP